MRAGASFVSVTQPFNTTTTMGRLTLNMLLSFAQFEREVTGERIRDKIAASKRKGLWMGGPCRSAMRCRAQAGAGTGRGGARPVIYRAYLDLGTVRLVQQHLAEKASREEAAALSPVALVPPAAEPGLSGRGSSPRQWDLSRFSGEALGQVTAIFSNCAGLMKSSAEWRRTGL